jgi:hypothetical protein
VFCRLLFVLLSCFVTRLTRRVPLVEQELLTLQEHLSSPPVFSGVRVTRSLVLCACFVDRCLPFCSLFLLLQFVQSRHIHSTVMVCPLRSELFYFLQFQPTGNCFIPWPSFRMSNQNEMRKLSWITPRSFIQSPVHVFFFSFFF